MYQGETITTTITGLPIPVSEIANLYIIFRNQSRTLLEKTLADCTVTGETIEFRMTQAESLSLGRGQITRSIIVITKDGSRFESCPSSFFCAPSAKNEVLQ